MKTIDIPEMYEVTVADGFGMSEKHVCYYMNKADADNFADTESKKKNWPYYVRTEAAKSITVLETGENPNIIRVQVEALQQAKELAEKLKTLDTSAVDAILLSLQQR